MISVRNLHHVLEKVTKLENSGQHIIFLNRTLKFNQSLKAAIKPSLKYMVNVLPLCDPIITS